MDMNFWLGLASLAATVIAGFGCFHFIRQGAKIKSYITTEGTVVSAEMTSYKSRGSNGKGRAHTYYEPSIEYAYTVGGRKYSSASFLFGGRKYGSTSREEVVKIVDHPVGTPITVFYNPDKPEQSFLDKKTSISLASPGNCLIFTILFGAAGIWMLVVGIKGEGSWDEWQYMIQRAIRQFFQ